MHSLLVQGGFIICVDLERRIFVYPDMTIGIAHRGFTERTTIDLVTMDPLGFGLVFLFGDALDEALVTGQNDLFATDASLALSAHVFWGTRIATAMHFIV